ncbi:MAG: sugar ABC transporter permease [Anaerolineae bacterium]|nr:sugar ABC transporter permease [Anaerolineae bacterium]
MQNVSHGPRGLFAGRKGRARQETLTAYLFLLPAILIILVFGLWPVVHALYVSMHKWNILPRGSQCFPYWFAQLGIGSPEALEQTDCLGMENYADLLGLQNVGAVVGLILFTILVVLAYNLLRRIEAAPERRTRYLAAAGVAVLLALFFLIRALPGLLESGEWTYLVSFALFVLAWLGWRGAGRTSSTLHLILRLLSISILLSAAAYFFFVDFRRMWELGDASFFRSLIYTVFYSAGTVPVQLGLSLILAYILFQGIRGKGAFRLLYFMPYIAPSVATAVVFKRIFSLRETALMNEAMGLAGLPPLRWLHEADGVSIVVMDLINQVLGTTMTWPDIAEPLNTILMGPSLALVSIIIYNWWVFIGYDTVIYLAGMGGIPTELYEAAEIDGAGRWSLFRRITIPLLSPTTFFLTVIATIGTFKAFNHIWIMKENAARYTVDTTSILIFQTFRGDGQFGEAAAMSFILFGIILALSQIQNRIGEKLVFYG